MNAEVFKTVLASLVAATSLLARAEDDGVKPSKAVASNAMFRQMVKDYDAAILLGRETVLADEATRSDDIEHLLSLNKDAHAIIDRIWDIFGRPSYEDLGGRTIYDMVKHAVDWERETAAVNEQMVGLLQDRSAENEAQKAEISRLRDALEFYANPDIYKPHSHGPAFDRRDLSFHARSVLDASLTPSVLHFPSMLDG